MADLPSVASRSWAITSSMTAVAVAVWWRLPALLVGALAIRLVFFGGLLGWDDVEYMNAARALRDGDYLPASSFKLRHTVTMPLALCQGWFGEGEWAAALVPLTYSLAHLALADRLGMLYGGPAVATVAVGLLAILPLDILAATDLHADLPLAVFLTAAMFAVLRGERAGRARGAWFFGAGVALGLGTISKEVALAFVVVLVLRATLVIPPVRLAAYAWLVAGLLTVAIVETTWLAAVTGTPWYRLVGPAAALHRAMMVESPPGFGWMLSYPAMLVDPRAGGFGYFAGVFFLVAGGSVWGLRRGHLGVRDLTVWWATFFVLLNFAPLDATFTRPLFHHFARTLHPLLVPFALVSATWLCCALRERPVARVGVATGFVTLAVVGIVASHADYRAWTAVARQAAVVVVRLPRESWITADPLTANQLRVLVPARRERIVDWSGDTLPAPRPLYVLSDASATGEGTRAAPSPPPAGWELLAEFDHASRSSVRAALRRAWRGDGGAVGATRPRATLWKVRS